MKIIVIGDGKVGFTLTEVLTREGHDVTVIDNRKEVLSAAEERLDVMVIGGNGASASVLKQAGVQQANLLISVTARDEVNMLCCMLARKLGCQHTIARVREADYTNLYYLLRDELGLSMVVNPERSAAREIFGLIRYPSLLKRDLIAKGRAEIVEMPVRPGGKLDGLRLVDMYGMIKTRVLVCAVERRSEVFIPDGRFTLKGDDRIWVTAPSEHLLSFIRYTGMETSRPRSVMILGGSLIGFYLAQMLLKTGIDVKLLDIDKAQCESLSESLDGLTVVNDDATNLSVLLNEGIEESDAVVSLLNYDEQNIVISMFANDIHVPKVITKINRTEYSDILRKAGIECVITPRILCTSDILRHVRAAESRQDSEVLALHRMVENQVEALEFRASSKTWYLDVPLKNVPLKKDILIAAIGRSGAVIIPGGDSSFLEGDTVVIVVKSDMSLINFNDIFSKQP